MGSPHPTGTPDAIDWGTFDVAEGAQMTGLMRRFRVGVVAGVVAIVMLMTGVLAACGTAKQAPETTSSTSPPQPTTKIIKPGGPNSFTPAPLTPLSPTVGSGPGGGGVTRP